MKILITGGCGFIGSNLIRKLLGSNCGFSVTNVDQLTYAANPQSLADYAESDKYKFIRTSIADPKRMDEVVSSSAPDAIIHLAAESHVDRSIDDPTMFIQTNFVGTFNLLQSSLRYYQNLAPAQQSSFRFLHVSTDEVFGTLGKSGRFSERSAYAPNSPYAATKAAADHLVRAWHTTYGLPTIVTNCSNNFGPYQFPEKLIPLMILKCIQQEPLPIYGTGDNVRDWLFVTDHVEALISILGQGRPGETYNIGCNCELTNIELVLKICEIMDELHPRNRGKYAELITFVADRPGHDYRYAIDASKITWELSWRSTRSLTESLRSTVQWYLDNQKWWSEILARRYNLERLGKSTTHQGEQT